MAFIPYYQGSNLSPLFHLLDDYDVHRSSRPKANNHQHHQHRHQPVAIRSFTPNFDVRELNDGFYLDGELPGADQNNIEIEFSDPNTLVIKGRVERNYNNTNSDERNTEAEEQNSDTSSNKSYHATVEDEEDETSNSTPAKPSTEKTVANKQHQPSYKYRISERSVGEFHRTFTFPSRIDQDAVKASLRNGVLSLVVPKEPAPKLKKVRIE